MGSLQEDSTTSPQAHQHDENTVWTCSMHPQIRNAQPGKCALCGMDLIPVEGASTNDMAGMQDALELSSEELRLAGVRTVVIGAPSGVGSLELQGTVGLDERGISLLSAHVEGRIEQLPINYPGMMVRSGQALAQINSPELYAAQQELLQAYRQKSSRPELYTAARNKLKQWKWSDREIDQLATASAPSPEFTYTADRSGVVRELKVRKGQYIQRGEPLMEIADLGTVWIQLHVYEQDLSRVKVGQMVEITTDAQPGLTIASRISYIDPLLDSETRTVRARAEVSNPSLTLKPGMLVRARLIETAPSASNSVTVPATAVLWTGSKAFVYVQNGSTTQNVRRFKRQAVVLGPRMEDHYIIEDGLNRGDTIVVHAAFTIDASAQLKGVPSMMD
jgi:Cu(I)/Ag(I) efflux system membrane fusion protein